MFKDNEIERYVSNHRTLANEVLNKNASDTLTEELLIKIQAPQFTSNRWYNNFDI